jgi:hypothetical protein
MLAKKYRIVVENKSGDQVTMTIKHTPYLPGGDGTTSKVQYQTELTDMTAVAIGDQATAFGADQDNDAAGNYGGHVDITAVGVAGSAGDVYIYLEGTGTSFVDLNAVQSDPVGTITLSGANTYTLQGVPIG